MTNYVKFFLVLNYTKFIFFPFYCLFMHPYYKKKCKKDNILLLNSFRNLMEKVIDVYLNFIYFSSA